VELVLRCTVLGNILCSETTETESQNYGYKFGRTKKKLNIVAAHGYFLVV
jgi:hypothetical protein